MILYCILYVNPYCTWNIEFPIFSIWFFVTLKGLPSSRKLDFKIRKIVYLALPVTLDSTLPTYILHRIFILSWFTSFSSSYLNPSRRVQRMTHHKIRQQPQFLIRLQCRYTYFYLQLDYRQQYAFLKLGRGQMKQYHILPSLDTSIRGNKERLDLSVQYSRNTELIRTFLKSAKEKKCKNVSFVRCRTHWY